MGSVSTQKGSNDLLRSPAARLRYIMEVLGFSSDYAMARATGISRSALKNILHRDRIGPKSAREIANSLGLSVAWVESGFGPMHAPDEGKSSVGGVAGQVPGRAQTGEFADTTGVQQPPAPQDFIFVRQILPRLSDSGGLLPAREEAPEVPAFSRNCLLKLASSIDDVAVMEVISDTMAPTLMNGGYVLIDLLRTELEDGRVYAVAVGRNIAIRRVQLTGPDRLTAIPDNPVYRPNDFAFTDLKIVGQIIWSCRSHL